jgi:4-carboxymuconolactone decarboxylase
MTQRIPALSRDEIGDSLLGLPSFQRGDADQPFNIYRTLAHHPDLVTHWTRFADALRFEGTLPDRSRELLILRTSVNTGCEYEWGQHVPYGVQFGIIDAELDALHEQLDAFDWSPADHSLLAAADELHEFSDITDATWDALNDDLTYKQLIEVGMIVGQYHLVAYLMNGMRVERDPALVPFRRADGVARDRAARHFQHGPAAPLGRGKD